MIYRTAMPQWQRSSVLEQRSSVLKCEIQVCVCVCAALCECSWAPVAWRAPSRTHTPRHAHTSSHMHSGVCGPRMGASDVQASTHASTPACPCVRLPAHTAVRTSRSSVFAE